MAAIPRASLRGSAAVAPTVVADSAHSTPDIVPARSAPGAPALATLPRISLGGRALAPSTPHPVSRDADLSLVNLLGEGGMGRVHLAKQRSLGREVAVKTLKEDATESARAALLSEAVITGFLEHPGIIPVHALGVDDGGHPVLVMKRVEGISWRELLYDDGAALAAAALLLTAVSAVGAATLFRWLSYTALCFGVGAAGCMVLTESAPLVFSVSQG